MRLWLAGVGLALSALYSVPQLLHYAHGGRGAFYLSDDEPAYAARTQRAMQGRWGVGNPWTFEGRDDPATIPPLAEDLVALVARAFGARTADPAVVGAKLVLPPLGFLAMFLALTELGMAAGAALLAAVWMFVEANTQSFTPFSGLLLHLDYFANSRFLNPLLPLVTFFLTLAAGARAFRGGSPKWAALAGAGLGAHFYISIFYWTHLAAGFLLAALLTRRWKVLGIGVAVATGVALPYAFSVLRLREHAGYADFVWRNGVAVKDRAFWSLANKRLWLAVAGAFSILWFRRDSGARVLVAMIGGGLLCFYSSLFTGVWIQNFHWNYTNGPLVWAGVVWAADELSRRKLPPRGLLALRSTAALLVAAMALHSAGILARWYDSLKAEHEKVGFAIGLGDSDQPYFAAWDWLRAHAVPDDVLLAGQITMPAAPSRTGLRIWMDGHTTVELTPMREQRERLHVLWALEKRDAAGARKAMTFPDNFMAPMWMFGMSDATHARLVAEDRPDFHEPLRRALADELAREYGSTDARALVELAHRYRLDWIALGPNEAGWNRELLARLWSTEEAGDFGGVRVYRVRGFKP